jgi:hypothetical protein
MLPRYERPTRRVMSINSSYNKVFLLASTIWGMFASTTWGRSRRGYYYASRTIALQAMGWDSLSSKPSLRPSGNVVIQTARH